MDDNIRFFYRSHKNTKLKCLTSAPFRICEDFTDRFTNVAMSGMNYNYFMPCNVEKIPYYLNTRIYSCILLSNDIKHRWRGKYNEDTDLSLRILKDKHCTILLNSFTCGKVTTLTMKGGNTEEIYKLNKEGFDNRYEFAKSLYDQHPDVVEITQKWGRFHHHVDYSSFAHNKLELNPDYVQTKNSNEYGMRLVHLDENGKPDRFVDTSGVLDVTDNGEVTEEEEI